MRARPGEQAAHRRIRNVENHSATLVLPGLVDCFDEPDQDFELGCDRLALRVHHASIHGGRDYKLVAPLVAAVGEVDDGGGFCFVVHGGNVEDGPDIAPAVFTQGCETPFPSGLVNPIEKVQTRISPHSERTMSAKSS